jgi:group I intron endonuclease
MNCKSGIYAIINIVNNRWYIGSAVNVERRWYRHRSDLRTQVHINRHLQRSWNKYGEQAFVFLFLEECEKNDLLKREQYYIDLVNPGFNILKIAGSQLGIKRSLETRKKMSDAKKGKPSNFKGKSSSMKGKKRPKEICQRLSELRMGKHHTEETKQKISESQRGRILSEEHRRKISEGIRNKKSRVLSGES